MRKLKTSDKSIELITLCKLFIDQNDISCSETIYQTDHVIENAYEFIEQVCDLVGYKKVENE
jgi:hypothetical protein